MEKACAYLASPLQGDGSERSYRGATCRAAPLPLLSVRSASQSFQGPGGLAKYLWSFFRPQPDEGPD